VLIEGTLTARDDVIGGGKSLKGHRHGGAIRLRIFWAAKLRLPLALIFLRRLRL
jgi:hypothetical protein